MSTYTCKLSLQQQKQNFQKHCRSSKKFKFFDFVFKELNKESFKLWDWTKKDITKHKDKLWIEKRQTRSFANNVKIENNLCQEEESQRQRYWFKLEKVIQDKMMMMMMFLKLETDKKTKKKYVNWQHAHAN